MKLSEALASAKMLRPHAADEFTLSQLLFRGVEGDVADMFGVEAPENPNDGTEAELTDTELLMPHPYDEVYTWYLCAMIDMANEETTLYQNDMEMYNAAWDRAASWYRRKTKAPDKGNWRTM